MLNIQHRAEPTIVSVPAEELKLITPTQQTLISAAMPLLAFMVSIRNTTQYNMADELRLKLLQIINHFEIQLKTSGYTDKVILVARYCLCTALDEAIFSTPWGSNSVWAQRSLLATIHKETWGGEKFYILIEKLLAESDVNIELLELFYYILSLGFEGKYFNDKNKLINVRNSLFSRIRQDHNEPCLPFAKYAATSSIVKAKKPRISIWIVIGITLITSLVIDIFSESYINRLTHLNLNNISQLSHS